MSLVNTNLNEIDFSELYIKQMKVSTFKNKSSEDWNKKAKNMRMNVENSIYTKEFIGKIDFSDAKSILDIGCGPGTIALKVASKVEDVYALDYSTSMLECVENICKNTDITNVKTINASWYDNWDNVPNTDIVVASRSIEVRDIKEAILKLNSKANKRVYLTTKVGGSFIDKQILNQLKREIYPRPDYIYLLNVLHNMGIYAKVDFIKSENNKFNSFSAEEFIEKVSWSLGELNLEERDILKNYFEVTYKFQNNPNYIVWAFISWEK